MNSTNYAVGSTVPPFFLIQVECQFSDADADNGIGDEEYEIARPDNTELGRIPVEWKEPVVARYDLFLEEVQQEVDDDAREQTDENLPSYRWIEKQCDKHTGEEHAEGRMERESPGVA